jgi:hypothetical protein
VAVHKSAKLLVSRSDAAAQRPARDELDRIVAERDALIAELGALRARPGGSNFAGKAQTLLTRWWSGASWSGRRELLRSAAWLVQLEKRRGAKA